MFFYTWLVSQPVLLYIVEHVGCLRDDHIGGIHRDLGISSELVWDRPTPMCPVANLTIFLCVQQNLTNFFVVCLLH